MYCIYCNENHEEDTPLNREHIVPQAIGGPGSFSFRVCEKSNSELGDKVDGPFIRMFLVNNDRFYYGLQSYRGEPTLDLSGMTQIDGKDRKIKYVVTAEEKVFKMTPLVEPTRKDAQEMLNVSGDPMDARRILLGKLSSVEKAGKTLSDEFGNLVTKERIEALIAEKTTVHENPSVLITLHIDPYDAVRFFCKLALATGFHVFGEPFGRSAIGQRLRMTMTAENEEIALPGPIWPFDDSQAEVYKYFRVPDTHVLAVLPGDEAGTIISLFGGKYTASIQLRDASWSPVNPVPQDGRVFQIGLKTRQFTDSSLGQYLLKRAWIQDAEPEA
jgi:hypothetical protein